MVTLVDNSVNGIRDAISTIIFIYPHTTVVNIWLVVSASVVVIINQ